MINVYFNSNQTALQFLSQNIVNLNNTIIITGNFNIRNSNWDPNFHHHSIHTDDLFILADSLELELSPLLFPNLLDLWTISGTLIPL